MSGVLLTLEMVALTVIHAAVHTLSIPVSVAHGGVDNDCKGVG